MQILNEKIKRLDTIAKARGLRRIFGSTCGFTFDYITSPPFMIYCEITMPETNFNDFLSVLAVGREPGLAILTSDKQISAVTGRLVEEGWQELKAATWLDTLETGSKLFLIYHFPLDLTVRSLLLQFASGQVQINQADLTTKVINLKPTTQLLILITITDYYQLITFDTNLFASFGPTYRHDY